jgi:hypothetical protein
MDKLFIVVVFLVIGIWVGFMIQLFEYNLPNWCTHPYRPGNSIIQPLCH